VGQFSSGPSVTHHGAIEVSTLVLAPGRSTHIYRRTEPPDLSFDPPQMGNGDVTDLFLHPQDDLVAYITRHRVHPRFVREDVLS
jgi:hypothetical protein